MNMRFYMVPGSCSTGIHILLEELEKVFEVYMINIPKGENQQEAYLSVNSKGTIPTLVLEDGTALTEFQSIAYYLALTNPGSKLLPADPLTQAKTIEIMAYVVNTIHGQGFARILATENFMVDGSNEKDIKAQGMEIVRNGFEIIEFELKNKDISLNEFTIADAALFYVEFWANKLDILLPCRSQEHYENMLNRDVVKRVLMEEGYHYN